MTGPMFDLEGCEDAVLINNETTSEKFIKARNCPRIHLEGNKAGLNELGKLGLPVDALNEEQINALVSEIIEREGQFSDKGNSWLTNSATFATLAADVQSTVIGVLVATGVSCYKTIKSKLLK
ncbi:hypothetical protein V9657_004587 [Vibrio vulnificus]|nr:hypothetical protein [Vibrio vulnificus]EHZ2848620.1 hypothetical protein [Vibrio vulnificus]EIZ1284356.1 hypothetical protein [Vibrio vulnificus]EKE1120932.1 hypothetical protein [Vibrio vulnificus]EME0140576.1 hypothetical protein [Vibrio vulnificus]